MSESHRNLRKISPAPAGALEFRFKWDSTSPNLSIVKNPSMKTLIIVLLAAAAAFALFIAITNRGYKEFKPPPDFKPDDIPGVPTSK